MAGRLLAEVRGASERGCLGAIDRSRFGEDRKAFEKLLESADDAALVTPFAWGDGQIVAARGSF